MNGVTMHGGCAESAWGETGMASALAAMGRALDDGFASLVRILNVMHAKVDAVCGVVVGGDDRAYPWDRLNRTRRGQVLAVRDHMTDNPSHSIWRSCLATFRPTANGYPSAKALSSYCYQIRLGLFAGKLPR